MTRRIWLMFLALVLIAVGLGIYAWQFHRKVTRDAERLAQEQQEMALPASGPETAVTLYVASDADGSLHRATATISLPAERSERARAVLRALFGTYLQSPSTHPIGPGADVRDVYLLSDGTAVIDTNAAFADSHPSGVLAEELTVASIVVTLNTNDNAIQRVKILVDGKERETLAGHADLRRFYLASNLAAVMKELQ
jgi:spore germination protein GerM